MMVPFLDVEPPGWHELVGLVLMTLWGGSNFQLVLSPSPVTAANEDL